MSGQGNHTLSSCQRSFYLYLMAAASAARRPPKSTEAHFRFSLQGVQGGRAREPLSAGCENPCQSGVKTPASFAGEQSPYFGFAGEESPRTRMFQGGKLPVSRLPRLSGVAWRTAGRAFTVCFWPPNHGECNGRLPSPCVVGTKTWIWVSPNTL